ncbi:protein SEMI-ROLLED LEAF 2-like [Telopea speciosissima]|uniref:protein SEMI-ROLLED LEAF 2-like n=1 Tax=Telopea speciosissima TaxID=54955 RepID=UPI001CC499B3|nr:protein SEMI-ROLLED LEAF 2-like [Telopea speciosissima]
MKKLNSVNSVHVVETTASEREQLLLVTISELEARMINPTDEVAKARLKYLQSSPTYLFNIQDNDVLLCNFVVGCSNEGKIVKLCDYVATNPLQIPKIAKYLEQRQMKIMLTILRRVCMLAREPGKEYSKCCLRVSSLQCLSATIVHATLDINLVDDGERGEPDHNWVDEVEMGQLILATVIRHLNQKNVALDTQIKSDVVQIANALARQLRTRVVVSENGIISDVCRHLRKSIQAAVELVGQQESTLNISLQTFIEDCLLQIAKGIGDAQPLFDLMAMTLEKLPSMGSIFLELLFLQLLKTMMHPDVEALIGAHQIFAMILVPSSDNPRHDLASAFASTAALLEKLCREKGNAIVEKHGNNTEDDSKDREPGDEKQGWARKNLPNFYKISCSIVDRTTGPACLTEAVSVGIHAFSNYNFKEPKITKLSEDQTSQLLSSLWIQANIPDNLPSNFKAIAHSFSLSLIASCCKVFLLKLVTLLNTNQNIVGFFQLPISLRNISLDPFIGALLPSCQRSLFVLATAMLMFAAKMYPDPNDLLMSLVSNHEVDKKTR